MSQCVRTGRSAFSSGTMPAVLRASAPHVGLVGHGDLERVPLRAQVAGLLPTRELDAALVLEALATQAGSTQSAFCHVSHLPKR